MMAIWLTWWTYSERMQRGKRRKKKFIKHLLWSGNKNIAENVATHQKKIGDGRFNGATNIDFHWKIYCLDFCRALEFDFSLTRICVDKNIIIIRWVEFFWETTISSCSIVGKTLQTVVSTFPLLHHPREIKFYFILFTTTSFSRLYIKVRLWIKIKTLTENRQWSLCLIIMGFDDFSGEKNKSELDEIRI